MKYLSENWFGRMETLIRNAVDSQSGTSVDVPTTSNAIESYHGHMKQGELARKCVTARGTARSSCSDACVRRFGPARKHLRGRRVDWLLTKLLEVAAGYQFKQLAMRYGQLPINANVARPDAKPHCAAAPEPLLLTAAADGVPAPAPVLAAATAVTRAASSGHGFDVARARMTSLLAAAAAAGAGDLCRGRLVAACNELEQILQAHVAAPGAAAASQLVPTAAAAALPSTVRRFRSCLDTGSHASSGVAPPAPVEAAAPAAVVAPFARAAREKASKKRKRAEATAADLAHVAASQARWAGAVAAGDVVRKAKPRGKA